MHSQIRTRTRVAGLGLALLLATVASVQAGPQEDFETGAASYRNGDIVGAMPPLRRAADAGHVEAQLQFGFILDWSEENTEAVRYYRMAADSGDPRGQLELARMYLSGEGVEPDPEVARGWIEKAAAQRHAPALTQLGHGYLDGGLGLAADEAQARSHFQQALELGDSNGQRGLDEIARREAARRQAEAQAGAGTATPAGQPAR